MVIKIIIKTVRFRYNRKGFIGTSKWSMLNKRKYVTMKNVCCFTCTLLRFFAFEHRISFFFLLVPVASNYFVVDICRNMLSKMILLQKFDFHRAVECINAGPLASCMVVLRMTFEDDKSAHVFVHVLFSHTTIPKAFTETLLARAIKFSGFRPVNGQFVQRQQMITKNYASECFISPTNCIHMTNMVFGDSFQKDSIIPTFYGSLHAQIVWREKNTTVINLWYELFLF